MRQPRPTRGEDRCVGAGSGASWVAQLVGLLPNRLLTHRCTACPAHLPTKGHGAGTALSALSLSVARRARARFRASKAGIAPRAPPQGASSSSAASAAAARVRRVSTLPAWQHAAAAAAGHSVGAPGSCTGHMPGETASQLLRQLMAPGGGAAAAPSVGGAAAAPSVGGAAARNATGAPSAAAQEGALDRFGRDSARASAAPPAAGHSHDSARASGYSSDGGDGGEDGEDEGVGALGLRTSPRGSDAAARAQAHGALRPRPGAAATPASARVTAYGGARARASRTTAVQRGLSSEGHGHGWGGGGGGGGWERGFGDGPREGSVPARGAGTSVGTSSRGGAGARLTSFQPFRFAGASMKAFHLAWLALFLVRVYVARLARTRARATQGSPRVMSHDLRLARYHSFRPARQSFFSTFSPTAFEPLYQTQLGFSKPVFGVAAAASLVASVLTRESTKLIATASVPLQHSQCAFPVMLKCESCDQGART